MRWKKPLELQRPKLVQRNRQRVSLRRRNPLPSQWIRHRHRPGSDLLFGNRHQVEFVIPAQACIQLTSATFRYLESRQRGNDGDDAPKKDVSDWMILLR